MTRAYIFDPDGERYIPNPEANKNEDLLALAGETNALTIGEADAPPVVGTTPGGTASGTLYPPNTFDILQVVRNNPDGTSSVDLTVVIQDDIPGLSYEVRVSREDGTIV